MNSTLKDSLIWLVGFICLDLIFIFLIYLIGPDLIDNFIIFIILFTLLAIIFMLRLTKSRNDRKEKLLEEFLIKNSFLSKDALVSEFGSDFEKIFDSFQKSIKIKEFCFS